MRYTVFCILKVKHNYYRSPRLIYQIRWTQLGLVFSRLLYHRYVLHSYLLELLKIKETLLHITHNNSCHLHYHMWKCALYVKNNHRVLTCLSKWCMLSVMAAHFAWCVLCFTARQAGPRKKLCNLWNLWHLKMGVYSNNVCLALACEAPSNVWCTAVSGDYKPANLFSIVQTRSQYMLGLMG